MGALLFCCLTTKPVTFDTLTQIAGDAFLCPHDPDATSADRCLCEASALMFNSLMVVIYE